MEWSYPTKEMLAQDASGVGVVLERAAKEMGDPPITGTRFLYTAAEMMEATRAIEASVGTGDRLAVGFQTFEKFRRELATYNDIVRRGVHVTAFAQMPESPQPGGSGSRRDLFGMRWVELAPHRRHLENQWFLIVDGAEPIAFVGYDISSPEDIAEGGITNPNRHFAGFVSDDDRVIASLRASLDEVARSEVPHAIGQDAVERARAEHVRTIMCATDERDPSYRRAREAATELATKVGASLLLYDRSAESYLADPYPYPDVVGPDHLLTRLDVFRLGRAYLADQIDEGVAAGVPTSAWLPRTPGPKGMAEGAQRFRPDIIVLPAMERPSLMDRIRGNTIAKFRAAISTPIWSVSADGEVEMSDVGSRQPA